MGTAVKWLNDHPLYFDQTSGTIPAIHAAIRRIRVTQPVGLVVIDYLQLLQSLDKPAWYQKFVVTLYSSLRRLEAREDGTPPAGGIFAMIKNNDRSALAMTSP
jgi:replicative DNA helicase